MFLSTHAHEFAVPPSLLVPGMRCWRAIQVSLQVPWFIAGFKVKDEDVSAIVTMCFAWDTDMVSAIRKRNDGELVNLVCMLPPWRSASSNWEAKPIVAIHRDVSARNYDEYVFETGDGTHVRAMESTARSGGEQLELVIRITSVA